MILALCLQVLDHAWQLFWSYRRCDPKSLEAPASYLSVNAEDPVYILRWKLCWSCMYYVQSFKIPTYICSRHTSPQSLSLVNTCPPPIQKFPHKPLFLFTRVGLVKAAAPSPDLPPWKITMLRALIAESNRLISGANVSTPGERACPSNMSMVIERKLAIPGRWGCWSLGSSPVGPRGSDYKWPRQKAVEQIRMFRLYVHKYLHTQLLQLLVSPFEHESAARSLEA